METRYNLQTISAQIQAQGFYCTRCGKCCTGTDDDPAIVMVSPDEITAIMQYTGLEREAIARPFPQSFTMHDKEVTFEWALVHQESRCRFYTDGACSIYPVRPWICRTYPFMLTDGNLDEPSCCEGLGRRISPIEATKIAHDLIARARAEECEEEKIQSLLSRIQQVPGRRLVIDGEGITSIHG